MPIRHGSDKIHNEIGPIAYGHLFRLINRYSILWTDRAHAANSSQVSISKSGKRYATDNQN